MGNKTWTALTDCNMGGCPTIYSTGDSSDLLVQGFTEDTFKTPEGERAVRIPIEAFSEAVRELIAGSEKGAQK